MIKIFEEFKSKINGQVLLKNRTNYINMLFGDNFYIIKNVTGFSEITTYNDFLSEKGFILDSLVDGTVSKNLKTSKASASKVLATIDNSIKDKFDTDPFRKLGITGGRFTIVISKNPYDIFMMSSNRNWTSCMDYNKNNDINLKYLKQEIEIGTFISYLGYGANLTPEDILRNPLSRILIKPFINIYTHKIHPFVENKIYGEQFQFFHEELTKWLYEVYPPDNGIYYLHPDSYNDDMSLVIVNEGIITTHIGLYDMCNYYWELTYRIEYSILWEIISNKFKEYTIELTDELYSVLQDLRNNLGNYVWKNAQTNIKFTKDNKVIFVQDNGIITYI